MVRVVQVESKLKWEVKVVRRAKNRMLDDEIGEPAVNLKHKLC